jgi:hypothetical protein
LVALPGAPGPIIQLSQPPQAIALTLTTPCWSPDAELSLGMVADRVDGTVATPTATAMGRLAIRAGGTPAARVVKVAQTRRTNVLWLEKGRRCRTRSRDGERPHQALRGGLW